MVQWTTVLFYLSIEKAPQYEETKARAGDGDYCRFRYSLGDIRIDYRSCMRYHYNKICAAVNGGNESVFCIRRNGAFLSAAKGQAALRGD